MAPTLVLSILFECATDYPNLQLTKALFTCRHFAETVTFL